MLHCNHNLHRPHFSPSQAIDLRRGAVNPALMDLDDPSLKKLAGDPLATLAAQDLDPFSVDELHARITGLEAEIARTRAKIAFAAHHRASAESLFRR
jgi:uncharacterized small protein (DUF1192 family)